MYKVRNQLWQIVKVETIDPKIHRHHTWRQFNESDWFNWVDKGKAVFPKIETEDYPLEAMDLNTARQAYTQKFWRKPSSQAKLETLLAKIAE